MLRNTLLLKSLSIGCLILLLMVPLSMIRSVVQERNGYQQQTLWDIANSWTGDQRIIAPMILLPYRQRYSEKVHDSGGRYVNIEKIRVAYRILPAETLNITSDVATQLRRRGIYSVPVYETTIAMTGRFEPDAIKELEQSSKGFVGWNTPSVILGIQDLRGIGASPALQFQDKTLAFRPGSRLSSLGNGIHANLTDIDLSANMPFTLNFTLRGSQQLNFAPIAGNATLAMTADWLHPQFGGRFLPVERTITDSGFTARWEVSAFSTQATEFIDGCSTNRCDGVEQRILGVKFIETVDVYTRTDRATKYGILFVLLTFVAFLLTETLTKRRLHAVHYGLVGAALSIFYLLLISMAEHIGFGRAYLVATLACTTLIGIYLNAVFGDRRLAGVYATAIATLYGMLFMILRSEDYALLMGSLLLFMVLALIMLTTRRLDWEQVARTMARPTFTASDTATANE
ncbi:MAG: cell envelope integrity protein CreD [Pseudomonadota bacterium]